LASAVVKAADTNAASNVFMLRNIGPQNKFSWQLLAKTRRAL
jgi:hypothetical protein